MVPAVYNKLNADSGADKSPWGVSTPGLSLVLSKDMLRVARVTPFFLNVRVILAKYEADVTVPVENFRKTPLAELEYGWSIIKQYLVSAVAVTDTTVVSESP